MSPDAGIVIETPRLILRNWLESDLQPFAVISADPDVRRYSTNPIATTRSPKYFTK